MHTKTRYFLLASSAILVAGLCTVLVAYLGGLPLGATQASAASAELRYVSGDAHVVGFANVRDVMSSELRQRLQDGMVDGERRQQQEFQERTGIDLERDVDRVLVALVPGQATVQPAGQDAGQTPPRDGDGQDAAGVMIASGRFNATQLEAFARANGGSVSEYRGVRLIEGGEDRGDTVLAFLEPGVVAVGDRAAVRRAVDTGLDGGGVESGGELMRLVGEIDPTNSAWVVGRFDELADDLPDNVASQIPPIQWFTAGGHVNGGISGTLTAETRDAQSAEDLREVVRGFLALLRLQVGADQPDLGSALQGLQIGGAGSTVAISFSLPAQVIDAIINRERREAAE